MKNILTSDSLSIPLPRALRMWVREIEKPVKSVVVAGLIVVSMWMGISPVAANAVTIDFRAYNDAAAEREILWLARALYSESKIRQEQTLVAWVIRNRVESERFPDTYERVVRAKHQFSGLNPGDTQYWVNTSLTYEDSGPGWDSALEVAETVYHARGMLRPIGKNVFHFYSPHSVAKDPSWALDEKLVHTVRDTQTLAVRFAFYEDVE